MKKIGFALLALLSVALPFSANAVLVNNGAQIVVLSGTTISVEGNATSGQFVNSSDGASNGSVTLNGTMRVSGNITNNVVGSQLFADASSGAVNLVGTGQAIAGTISFPNLSKTVAAADTLTFNTAAANKTTVLGALTLQGAAGQLLSLRSSVPGTQWQIDPQGTRNLGYLNVQDSNNVNASTINVSGANCTDSGNNTKWIFTGTSYTVNFIAGPNGSITGATTQVVASGADCSPVNAVANTDYKFANWTGDHTGTENPLTITNVTKDMTVTANFAVAAHTVVFTAGLNGTITGVTNQTVADGADCSAVTAVPIGGYEFAGWTGDHTGTENPLTITNVTGNMNITANFVPITYTVTFTPGANGSISGTSPQTVASGGSCSAVTAVPAPGYHFLNWTGGYIGTENPLTVTNVTANMAITANFAANPVGTFTVTFVAGSGGSIDGTVSQTVASGGSCSAVNAVPAAGYHFTGWTGDHVGVENPLTVTNVTTNMAITANFAAQTFAVNFIAGLNGTITGTASQAITYGGSSTPVTAMPADGYYFVNWTGGTGFTATTQNPLTVMNVTADMTLTANFAKIPDGLFVVNFVAGAHGIVMGGASQLVVPGGNTSPVTAAPSAGYSFSSWTGGHTGVENPLTITNVTTDLTVTANFAANPVGTFTVTFVAGENGSVSGNVSQSVVSGDDCTPVNAVANPGYSFFNWTGDYTGGVSQITITDVTTDMTINANFGIPAYWLAVGKYLRITPSQVADFVGDQFTKKPSVLAYVDYANKKAAKASLKVLNKISAKPPLAEYADCEWGKVVKLYNPKDWNKAKTCAANLIDHPITALNYPEVRVSVTDPAGHKLNNVLVGQAVLQPPAISKVANSYGATISAAAPAEKVYIEGAFFGKTPPKVCLEYPVYEKGTATVKQINTISLKVQKPYVYDNYKGENGKGCMQITSGLSRIEVAMPSKWPKSWLDAEGNPLPGIAHNIVIDNKVGKATAAFGILK